MKRRFFLTVMVSIFIFSSMGSYPFAKKSKMTKQEKVADKLAKSEAKLEKVLGTNTNWKPIVFKNLKLGMTCTQVKQYFSGLPCKSSKKYDFARVPGKILGAVKEYKFYFKYGKLQSAILIFHRQLDKQQFKAMTLIAMEKKWRKVKTEKWNEDYLSAPKKSLHEQAFFLEIQNIIQKKHPCGDI